MSSARVVNLNNRAVAMLRHGQQKRALDTFRLAMETFHQQVQEEDPMTASAENTDNEGSASHPLPMMEEDKGGEESRVQVRSVSVKMSIDPCDDAADHLVVFNRALVLATDVAKHPDVILAALLYNLALVSHLRGLQTRIEARFRTALKLYGMAYEIIQAHDDQNIFDDIQILSLVNNMGHTQRRLGNLQEARDQLEFLRSVVGVGTPNNTTSPSTSSTYCPQVDEQDYFFFYLNAMEERVSAPAA